MEAKFSIKPGLVKGFTVTIQTESDIRENILVGSQDNYMATAETDASEFHLYL